MKAWDEPEDPRGGEQFSGRTDRTVMTQPPRVCNTVKHCGRGGDGFGFTRSNHRRADNPKGTGTTRSGTPASLAGGRAAAGTDTVGASAAGTDTVGVPSREYRRSGRGTGRGTGTLRWYVALWAPWGRARRGGRLPRVAPRVFRTATSAGTCARASVRDRSSLSNELS